MCRADSDLRYQCPRQISWRQQAKHLPSVSVSESAWLKSDEKKVEKHLALTHPSGINTIKGQTNSCLSDLTPFWRKLCHPPTGGGDLGGRAGGEGASIWRAETVRHREGRREPGLHPPRDTHYWRASATDWECEVHQHISVQSRLLPDHQSKSL